MSKFKFILLIVGLFLLNACSSTGKKSMKANPPIKFEEAGMQFEATLVLPKTFEKQLPLVVVVHEWWGKNDYSMKRAQMLADQGYAALAVDLYGDGKTADSPDGAKVLATPFYQNSSLGVERLRKYIELAKHDPHVDAAQVFAIGYCFGGTQVLNLARSGESLKGVASFHGGLTPAGNEKSPIAAKVLVLNGAADPMVPAKDVKAFKNEMKKRKAALHFVDYPGALHAFTNPKATEVGKKYGLPVAYDEKSDAASWQELMKFLR